MGKQEIKNKQKGRFDLEKLRTILLLIAFGMMLLSTGLAAELPGRDISLFERIFSICAALIATGASWFALWFRNGEKGLLYRIFPSVSALLLAWLPVPALTAKPMLAVCILLTLADLILLVIGVKYAVLEKAYPVKEFLFAASLPLLKVYMVADILDLYNFLLRSIVTPILYIPLIIGGIIALISIPFLQKYAAPKKKSKKKGILQKGRLPLTVSAVFLVTVLICIPMLLSVNVLFDTSSPESYTVAITDASPGSVGKYTSRPDRFEVVLDGETHRINVPLSVFDRYSVGDRIELHLYQGALGEPYMIAADAE